MSYDAAGLHDLIARLSPHQQRDLLQWLIDRLEGSQQSQPAKSEVRESASAYPARTHGGVNMQNRIDELVARLALLTPVQQGEVNNFIEFLLYQHQEQQTLGRALAHASESAFAKVWDNDEDAAYDDA